MTLRQPDDLSAGARIVIQPMAVEDLDGVLEIERVSFPTPWSRAAYYRELTDNSYAHYLVAKAGDLVAGYAGMWVLLDEAHVTNIAVRPQYRRRGIGEALMLEMMAIARDKSAARMTLEVRPSNKTAQKLYQKLGFVPRGIRKRYYSDTKEDAIVMWKDSLADHA